MHFLTVTPIMGESFRVMLHDAETRLGWDKVAQRFEALYEKATRR